uniref:Ig-like domain-containing protein n=1 Tax=Panagrolaimus sp. PS1159 TaxID=55785 RepID=A0AC35GM64_9BILA
MIKARWYFKKLRLLLLFIILIIFGFAEGNIISNKNEIIVKTSDDFETPICEKDNQCVVGGVCRPDATGKKRCMCSSSCLMTVPVKCVQSNPVSCLTMGENYVSKYNTSLPYCHHNRCVCPPLYDPVPVKSPTPGVPFIPPFKCDKRELQIMLAISPADAVYKGTEATFYCCVNVDPRDFIPEEGVYFVQNGTRRREASTTPYHLFTTTDDSLFTVPTCWALSIANVQLSDSGTYSCLAQPLAANAKSLNETLNFTVKSKPFIFTVRKPKFRQQQLREQRKRRYPKKCKRL